MLGTALRKVLGPGNGLTSMNMDVNTGCPDFLDFRAAKACMRDVQDFKRSAFLILADILHLSIPGSFLTVLVSRLRSQ